MIKDNKSLIVKRETIFKKIAKFLKNIFKKDKIQENLQREYNYEERFAGNKLKVQDNIFLEYDLSEIITNPMFYDNFEEHIYENDTNYKSDKEHFFQLYNNLKNGIIKIDAIKSTDLIRINQMLKEELKLKTEEKLEKLH